MSTYNSTYLVTTMEGTLNQNLSKIPAISTGDTIIIYMHSMIVKLIICITGVRTVCTNQVHTYCSVLAAYILY